MLGAANAGQNILFPCFLYFFKIFGSKNEKKEANMIYLPHSQTMGLNSKHAYLDLLFFVLHRNLAKMYCYFRDVDLELPDGLDS